MLNKTKKKRMPRCTVAFILTFVTLPVIQWLVFYVYVNFEGFFMAFQDANGRWTSDNFVRFWKELSSPDSLVFLGVKNALITFALNVIQYPFTVLVSYFLYKKVPGSKFFRIVFFLPSMLFSVCQIMAFKQIINVNGPIAAWIGDLLNLGYPPELLADDRFANYVVWFHMLWLAFPGALIIWGGTFARIPEELLEAGAMDGVVWWQEFIYIIVPLIWPTVALNLVTMSTGILFATGSVFLLTNGQYGTMTFSVWQYMLLLGNAGGSIKSNVYNYLSAIGLVVTVITLGLTLGVRKVTGRINTDIEF